MGSENSEKSFVLNERFQSAFMEPHCLVHLPHNLEPIDLWGTDEVVLVDGKEKKPNPGFAAFKNWLPRLLHNLGLQANPAHTFHNDPYILREITVQVADWFIPKDKDGRFGMLGFLKLQMKVETKSGQWIPGAIFMRGGSVGMLIILQPNDNPDEKWVILTIQPRVPAGSLAFTEIPAGMIDDNNFVGAAATEIKEETTLEVKAEQLFSLTDPVTSHSTTTPWKKNSHPPQENGRDAKESLVDAMYPSVGGCDEFMALFLCQKKVPRAKLEKLRGLATGLREEGEKITLRLVRLEDLCVEAGRDAKALSAYGLYRYHKDKKTEGINDVYEDDLPNLGAGEAGEDEANKRRKIGE